MGVPELLEDEPAARGRAGRSLLLAVPRHLPVLDRVAVSPTAVARTRRMLAVLAGLGVLVLVGREIETTLTTPADAGPVTAAPAVSSRLSSWPLRGDLRREVGDDLSADSAIAERARRMVARLPGSRLLFAGHVGGTQVLLTALEPGHLFVRDGSASASYKRGDGSWVDVPVRPADATVFAVEVPADANRTAVLVVAPPQDVRVSIAVHRLQRSGHVERTRMLLRASDGVVTVTLPASSAADVRATLFQDGRDPIPLPLYATGDHSA